MIQGLSYAGFREVRMGEFFDCFAGTSKESTARKFDVRGANFVALKQ